MAVTQTTRLKLAKQALGDANWHTALNQGFDDADLRVMSTGAGSPVGVAEGFYVGAFYFQTSPAQLWVCTAVGTPGTWVGVLGGGGDVLAALVLANTIALRAKESGGTARDLAVMNASNKVLLGALTNLLTIQTNGANALKVEYGSGEQTVWHAGNGGTGSGLDADQVDGLHKTSLLTYDTAGGLYFESAEITMLAAKTVASHGLGSVPRLIQVTIRCKAAGGEGGYSLNDEVNVWDGMSASGVMAMQVWRSATEVGFSQAGGPGMQLVDKNTGGLFNAVTNWKAVFRAWK